MKNVVRVFLIAALVSLGVGITMLGLAFAGGVTKASLEIFGNDNPRYGTHYWYDHRDVIELED